MVSEKAKKVLVYGSAVFFIVLGILIGSLWIFIFDFLWRDNLQLKPESETFKLWRKTPVPIYISVYLFNWTNSEEFMRNKGIKPKFDEVGPFVFEENHERVEIEWGDDNKTVSYNQTRKWIYIPEQSVSLSTPITNLNVVATTITKMASNYPSFLRGLVEFLSSVYKEKLIITRTANEWLFEGMEDKLLDFAKTFVKVPYSKFGWFFERNMSSSFDGRFSIKTGSDEVYDLGMLVAWNGENVTNYYPGKCGEVYGGTGELFAPLKKFQQNITVFISDFCSPIVLTFWDRLEKEELTAYHYVGKENVFDNGTSYPENKCFCVEECVPSGVRNLTPCRKAPLFVSWPHFYLADPSYTAAIEGMQPDKEKHELFIDIEQLSGLPLEVSASLQFNIHLQPQKNFYMFYNVPDIYIPMMWFTQKAKITPDLVEKGKQLAILSNLGIGLGCALVLLGFLIVTIRICIISSYFTRTSSQMIPIREPHDQRHSQRHSQRPSRNRR